MCDALVQTYPVNSSFGVIDSQKAVKCELSFDKASVTRMVAVESYFSTMRVNRSERV